MAKKGQSGIGALIVFIAFVLTAALAAFVITQTTVGAQQKAAAVADQARERTGTTLEILRVEGEAVNQTVQNMTVFVRLAPGSSPINLNTTALIYYYPGGSQVYTLGLAASNTTFAIDPNLSVSATVGSIDNILEAGELYVVHFVPPSALNPSESWRIAFIPKEGMPAEAYGVAPDYIPTSGVVVLR